MTRKIHLGALLLAWAILIGVCGIQKAMKENHMHTASLTNREALAKKALNQENNIKKEHRMAQWFKQHWNGFKQHWNNFFEISRGTQENYGKSKLDSKRDLVPEEKTFKRRQNSPELFNEKGLLRHKVGESAKKGLKGVHIKVIKSKRANKRRKFKPRTHKKTLKVKHSSEK